jgi:pimeloyl-ACP methyl ester carboxylesterase
VESSIDDVVANGMTFRVRSAGPVTGRPVILLHGFPQTSQSFARQIASLGAAGYRAIAPDQRGYSPGARPAEVGAYHISELVSDVVALADALDIDSFDLVGHDWGGLVAWATAGAHPERVRTHNPVSTPHPNALVAALATGDPDQTKRSAYLELLVQIDVAEQFFLGEDGSGSGLRQIFANSGIDDATTDVYVDCLVQPGALTAALNWYRANDLHTPMEIGPITMPTLYVWSTEDMALGRVAAEATAGFALGPYRFEVLEGVTHWIPDVEPQRLTELLLGHLADYS